MPSDLHEAIVELLREAPGRIVDIVRDAVGAEIAVGTDPAAARIIDPTIPQLVAPAHACDLVIELPAIAPAPGGPLGDAVIVEVQLHRRRRKELSWPLYWAALRTRLRGGTVWIIVVTNRASVERWAAAVLEDVIPRAGNWRVIGPRSMTRITDPTTAARDPEVALLSALIHAGGNDADLAPAIATACSALPPERGILIHDLLVSRLSRQALNQLEVLMQKKAYVWKSDFARTHRAQGREEGLQQGLRQGQDALKRSLLVVLETRGLALSPEHRARIAECEDTVELERWVRRAVTATAVSEVFDLGAAER